MAGEVEVFCDSEGVVVAGERFAVDRFLGEAGLLSQAQEFRLGKLSNVLRASADIAKTASGVAEQSASYLKLTPESAKRLKKAGGLMSTKTDGISYAMLGETGKHSLKWLQVEDGPASLLTNPAVLAGVGGLMSQFAQQAEARELRALLDRIDEKLDDVRRKQRDSVLAELKSAVAAIDEARMIREHDGDLKTVWAKVSGVSETIFRVQEDALLELQALGDRIDGMDKPRELKNATQEVAREAAIQLAILARCFELQDEFSVIELDHVLATAPNSLDGHRGGVAAARRRRRESVIESTGQLVARMDTAGGIVNDAILLHARAARSVVESRNSTAATVDELHLSLGMEPVGEVLGATPWREALRDPRQRINAGKEVGRNAAVAGAVGASAVVMIARGGSRLGR